MKFESIEENRMYSSNPHVRARVTEFLGGETPEEATAVYITRGDACTYNRPMVYAPEELPGFFDEGCDIGRSLWDNSSLIAHLDIEYVNFDFTADPYLDRERSFEIQKPVIDELSSQLYQACCS